MIKAFEDAAAELEVHMEESLQDAIMCPGCGGVVLRHERVHDHNTLFRWVTIDDFDGGMQDAIDSCLAAKEFPWNKRWVRARTINGMLQMKICHDCVGGSVMHNMHSRTEHWRKFHMQWRDMEQNNPNWEHDDKARAFIALVKKFEKEMVLPGPRGL